MSGLLTMMQRAGWLSAAQAEAGEHFRAERGCSAVEAVLAVTEHDEAAIAEFLRSKLMIPMVDREILERVDPGTLARVPSALVREHQVLPVSDDDLGNLTLAMVDPTDQAAVEAVAASTHATIIRAVVAASDLQAVLEKTYGPATTSTMDEDMVAAAAIPMRALLPTAWAGAKASVLSALDRDQMTEALLQFGSRVFDRTILFVHARDEVRGHAGRGSDLLVEAVPAIRIPTGLPSVFANVIATGRPFHGPWPRDTAIDRAFAQAIGAPEASSVLVPFSLRDKIPILMFGTPLREAFDAAIFGDVAQTVGQVLAQLLVRRRASSE